MSCAPAPTAGSRSLAGPCIHESLLEAHERAAQLGSWEWLPAADQQTWSDNLFRIFGLEPGEIKPSRRAVLDQALPDDRDRVASYFEAAGRAERPGPIEYRILQPGGAVRRLRWTIVSIEIIASRAMRVIGAVQDITDQRLAEEEIAAHVAASTALADWDSLEEGAMGLLAGLGEAMDFVVGALWVPDRELLSAAAVWRASSARDTAEFESATRALRLPSGVGLPGLVWRSGVPASIASVVADPDYRRASAAARAGIRAALAFPALHHGVVLAVVELHAWEELRPATRTLETIGAIGYELGEFLSRRGGQLRRPPLTPRELQVLQLVADRCSGGEIGERLGISAATVNSHLKHIYTRLGLHDRAGAVAVALRLGLIA